MLKHSNLNFKVRHILKHSNLTFKVRHMLKHSNLNFKVRHMLKNSQMLSKVPAGNGLSFLSLLAYLLKALLGLQFLT